MRFRVRIWRRPGLADPEGSTTARALHDLGYPEVRDVRFGRDIVVELAATDAELARARVVEMCERLLANPVIEEYTVEDA
jgi:phosphoribosylformylglycinamidine synthase, purS protein